MSRVLALPAPGTKSETVNEKNKNTQLATKSNIKKLTESASFSGSRSRLGVGNESTYQTPSVGHRGIDQMIREHSIEMKKLQGQPTRMWMRTLQLQQNLEGMEQEASNAANQARIDQKKQNPTLIAPKVNRSDWMKRQEMRGRNI